VVACMFSTNSRCKYFLSSAPSLHFTGVQSAPHFFMSTSAVGQGLLAADAASNLVKEQLDALRCIN
jgi:hypothetical protein